MDGFVWARRYPDLAELLLDWEVEYDLGNLTREAFIERLDLLILRKDDPSSEIMDLALMTKASESDFIMAVKSLTNSINILSPGLERKILTEFVRALENTELTLPQVEDSFHSLCHLSGEYWNSQCYALAAGLNYQMYAREYVANKPYAEHMESLRVWALKEARKQLRQEPSASDREEFHSPATTAEQNQKRASNRLLSWIKRLFAERE